jgi:cellobiose-specific phosphotransferase system component IIA
MDDSTNELIKFYQMRVAALEDELTLTKRQLSEAHSLNNDLIQRSTHLYHQTQREIKL